MHFCAVISMIGEQVKDRKAGRDAAEEASHPTEEPAWRLSTATSCHLLSASAHLSSSDVCVCVCAWKCSVRTHRTELITHSLKLRLLVHPLHLTCPSILQERQHAAFRMQSRDYSGLTGYNCTKNHGGPLFFQSSQGSHWNSR